MDRLELEYGPDHPVVHYIAAMLPHQDPVTDKFTIAQLRQPEIAKRVGGVSTFYIPPKSRKEINPEIIQLLKFLPEGQVPDKRTQIYPPNQWGPSVPILPPYGLTEQLAVAQLETHTPPEQYQPLATSKAMTDAMTQLALDPKALARYKADPSAFAQSAPDLSPQERAALEVGNMWAIRCAMKDIPTSLLDAASQGSEELSPPGAPWIVVLGVIGIVASITGSG